MFVAVFIGFKHGGFILFTVSDLIHIQTEVAPSSSISINHKGTSVMSTSSPSP